MLAYRPIKWNSIDLLEIVEAYAEARNCGNLETIYGEECLSELFDQRNETWLYEHRDNQIAIDEYFCEWTDALCKLGELHPEQYDKYVYVGKYCE